MVKGGPTVFTSCFSRVKLLPAELTPVSIARWPPCNWKGRRYYALAPSADLLRAIKNGAIGWSQYKRQYLAQLSKLDAATVKAELQENAVLLCFCDPQGECHRYLAAEWLEKELDIVIREW